MRTSLGSSTQPIKEYNKQQEHPLPTLSTEQHPAPQNSLEIVEKYVLPFLGKEDSQVVLGKSRRWDYKVEDGSNSNSKPPNPCKRKNGHQHKLDGLNLYLVASLNYPQPFFMQNT